MVKVPSRAELEQALTSRVSKATCDKLRGACVGIAGLGGLGSNIAVFLARSGVGSLHLVDFDEVDISNLNRQHYFIEQVGQKKTDALASQLLRINPYLKLRLDYGRVSEDNVEALFSKDALVCEAFDRPEEKALLVNTVLERCPQTRIIASSGMAGVGSANSITTRKINRRFYLCGDGCSDLASDAPLFAPRVALCAAHQAHLVIRIILGEE